MFHQCAIMGGGCPQGMGFEWTPERQATNHKWSLESIEKGLTTNTTRSWWIDLDTMRELENCLKKLHRCLARKRRSWAKQQKSEVNEEPTRANVGEIGAGVPRERDEGTPICPTPAGRPFHPDWASVFVHVVLGWTCIGRSELMWQREIRGQKLVCVPDADAVCCFMQHLRQHQSVGQQITNDPLEKVCTRNTARSWWMALDTMKI